MEKGGCSLERGMFLEKKDVSWGRECALKRRTCFEEGGMGPRPV
jgi:hypothetical protein